MRWLPKKGLLFGGLLTKTIPDITLVEMLQRSVDRFSNRVFIQFEKKKLTFSQFNSLVNRLANYLSEQFQLQKGERVCLFAQNSIEFPIAFFAILKLGGIVIPVNSFFKAEELSHVIKNSQSRLVLVTESLKSTAEQANVNLSSPSEIVPLEQVLLTSLRDSFEAVSLSAEELAVFIYTSGTTGKPKGAMLTHKKGH